MFRKKKIIELYDGKFESEFMFFEKTDKKFLKSMFDTWVLLCQKSLKIGGTRTINFPETLSEAIFALEMDFARCTAPIRGTSSSFDNYDFKTNKRIQLKAASSKGPSSFGPRSEYDEIYFFYMKDIAEIRSPRSFSGRFEIYKLDETIIPSIRVNKNDTVNDFQRQGKRPRFSIPIKILDEFNPKVLKTGNIDDWD